MLYVIGIYFNIYFNIYVRKELIMPARFCSVVWDAERWKETNTQGHPISRVPNPTHFQDTQ